jgi:hypothetical protein
VGNNRLSAKAKLFTRQEGMENRMSESDAENAVQGNLEAGANLIYGLREGHSPCSWTSSA